MKYLNSLDTHNGRIGKLGEDYACEFLINKGHRIISRNFKNKVGEIDIISLTTSIDDPKLEKLHIVEVKTSQSQFIRAEENMNPKKMKKVARLGLLYARDRLFCIDFIGVTLNPDNSLDKITYLENLEIF